MAKKHKLDESFDAPDHIIGNASGVLQPATQGQYRLMGVAKLSSVDVHGAVRCVCMVGRQYLWHAIELRAAQRKTRPTRNIFAVSNAYGKCADSFQSTFAHHHGRRVHAPPVMFDEEVEIVVNASFRQSRGKLA